MLPRPLRRPVAWVSRTRLFRRFGPAVMPSLERGFSRVGGGRSPISGLAVPSLVLHTTGARTGEPRRSALMYCPAPDGAMIVTGSNFARPEHPAWTGNLLRHPRAEVELDGRRIPVTARLVPPEEREEVWRLLEENWPGYRGYERSSGRELRIFRLIPDGP